MLKEIAYLEGGIPGGVGIERGCIAKDNHTLVNDGPFPVAPPRGSGLSRAAQQGINVAME